MFTTHLLATSNKERTKGNHKLFSSVFPLVISPFSTPPMFGAPGLETRWSCVCACVCEGGGLRGVVCTMKAEDRKGGQEENNRQQLLSVILNKE